MIKVIDLFNVFEVLKRYGIDLSMLKSGDIILKQHRKLNHTIQVIGWEYRRAQWTSRQRIYRGWN